MNEILDPYSVFNLSFSIYLSYLSLQSLGEGFFCTATGMSVLMFVCDENKLCQLFKSYHDERGHQYLSKGEGPMSVDALGAHFWAFGPVLPIN